MRTSIPGNSGIAYTRGKKKNHPADNSCTLQKICEKSLPEGTNK